MQYRELGRTGLEVSALGFGSMRLSINEGQVDVESALQVLKKAFDLGINLVDTAIGYCNQQSEMTAGKALKGRREGIVLSTKNPYKGTSGAEWRALLDQSLRRLDVKWRDLYNFHAWAAACKECNECEPKCPRGLKIREQLKEAHKTLST